MARRRQRLATVAPIGIALIAGCAGPRAGKTAYVGAQVFDGTGGPMIAKSRTPSSWWPGAEGVRTPEQGRRAIDQLALADAALAKVSPRITRSLLRAITDEAAALELPVAAHLGRVDALTASRLGVNAIEHMTGVVEATVSDPSPYFEAHNNFYRGWNMFERGGAGLDTESLARTARRLAQARLGVVPTLTAHETYAHLNDRAYADQLDLSGVPEETRSEWNVSALIRSAGIGSRDFAAFRWSRPKQDQFVRIFQEAGGLLAAGTDSPNPLLAPGASLHDELQLLVAAGLTPTEALMAATRGDAQLLRADSIGVLQVGALADFLVLTGSPLDDISNTRNIEMVVLEGATLLPRELRELW